MYIVNIIKPMSNKRNKLLNFVVITNVLIIARSLISTHKFADQRVQFGRTKLELIERLPD